MAGVAVAPRERVAQAVPPGPEARPAWARVRAAQRRAPPTRCASTLAAGDRVPRASPCRIPVPARQERTTSTLAMGATSRAAKTTPASRTRLIAIQWPRRADRRRIAAACRGSAASRGNPDTTRASARSKGAAFRDSMIRKEPRRVPSLARAQCAPRGGRGIHHGPAFRRQLKRDRYHGKRVLRQCR